MDQIKKGKNSQNKTEKVSLGVYMGSITHFVTNKLIKLYSPLRGFHGIWPSGALIARGLESQ